MEIRKWWQAVKASSLHLCFPARCLHCQDGLPPSQAVLCLSCASLLELISPLDQCSASLRYPSLFLRTAAAFDYEGPAATLVKHLKYAHQPYLAQGLGAYLFTQWHALAWPVPDALIPVPLSFSRWFERGYNQSALLAEELSQLLQVPVWHALQRIAGGYSQAALTREQRQNLGKVFRWKKSHAIEDKVLLVIDDVMTSGATLHQCAVALSEGCPAALYALTVCRS